MKNKIVLICTFLCIAILAYSQTETDFNIEELINCDIINSDVSIESNQAYINQMGAGNEMITIQQQEGFITNSTLVLQQGDLNSGYIQQIGTAHFSKLIQVGTNNEANFWSVGEKTINAAFQLGDNNKINSYTYNQDFIPKSTVLAQNGNNNTIEVVLLGSGFLWNSWPKLAVIHQKGNDLEISAKLDSYNSPIYIKQQAGSAGGMKIDISNSDFSFPMK